MSDNLSDYPIIEVIFEIRWKLEEAQLSGLQDGKIDPHYAMLLGKLYEQLREEYGYIRRLDAENIPEIMAPYVLRKQFRPNPDGWPLVQVGPGIVTVNQTSGYNWEDFSSRISQLIKALFAAHPSPSELQVNSLSLLYINAEEFDYDDCNVLQFLKEKMNTDVGIEKKVFEAAGIHERPEHINLDIRFHCDSPLGTLHLRIGTGRKHDNKAVIWNTSIQSTGVDIPCDIEWIVQWAEDAHSVARKWFDAMTGRISS